jgi:hypothetical protein
MVLRQSPPSSASAPRLRRPIHVAVVGLRSAAACAPCAAAPSVPLQAPRVYGPLRPGDLLPDVHAAADDRQRYGAVSSQLADSPHRP